MQAKEVAEYTVYAPIFLATLYENKDFQLRVLSADNGLLFFFN